MTAPTPARGRAHRHHLRLRHLRVALQGALATLVVSHAVATALGYWLPDPWQMLASLAGFALTWLALRKRWI